MGLETTIGLLPVMPGTVYKDGRPVKWRWRDETRTRDLSRGSLPEFNETSRSGQAFIGWCNELFALTHWAQSDREFLLVYCQYLKRMAGTTRLELATSAVTGQRSNQLNYVPAEGWCITMVGTVRFERTTFRV